MPIKEETFLRLGGRSAINNEQAVDRMRVAVDYRPSRKTFRQATHAAWGSQLMFQALVLLFVALWVAAGYALGVGARLEDQLPTFTYLLMAVAFYLWYPSFAFSSDARNREEVCFEFTRAGVRYHRAGNGAELGWNALSQAVDTKDFYILSMPGRQVIAVPKFAFGPGEEQLFRLMAATSGVPIR